MPDSYIKHVYFANGLNEHFNKVWYSPPLFWSTQNLKFEYNSNNRINYLTKTIAFKVGTILICCLALIYGLSYPKIVSKFHLVAVFMDAFLVFCLIGADVIFFLEGKQIAKLTSWSYELEPWLSNYGKLDVTINQLLVMTYPYFIIFSKTQIQAAYRYCLKWLCFWYHFYEWSVCYRGCGCETGSICNFIKYFI